jgi:hypothetical protein
MLQTLTSPRAAHAKSRFMAAVALGPRNVVSETHADNRLLVCILGTHYGILAEIGDEQIELSIKAPGRQPHLATVATNEDEAIDAAVQTVFDQIASGHIFG